MKARRSRKKGAGPTPTWPRPVAAGLAAVLALLAGLAGARGLPAWRGPAVVAPAVPARVATDTARGPRRALVTPDPSRTLVDLALPGAGPRALILPRRARVADLLAAAGLPEGLEVQGAPDAGAQLLSGSRLVVGRDGVARLETMPVTRRLRLGLPLDLNLDGADALALLPGIGPARAAAIVEDRSRRGPFPTVAALTRVRGIGRDTAARLVGLVTAGKADRP